MPQTLPNARDLARISRPRFWIYVLGPYLVGLAAGMRHQSDWLSWAALGFGAFFTLPANLLIYGINDIFDWETDRRNPKKVHYETLVSPNHRAGVWKAIALTNLPFIPLLFFVPEAVMLSTLAFLFFSLFYSIPPIRAKSIPLLDSAFNVLYIFPGVAGYFIAGGQSLDVEVFIAACAWALAMHAYSAIPDIAADRECGLATVATWLGFGGTHVFCAVCYVIATAFAYPTLGPLSLVIAIVYSGLLLSSVVAGPERVFARYKLFPVINMGLGFVLFWAVVWGRFGFSPPPP